MEILLLTALIVLNGVFAMSEIALVTARRARLARLAGEGSASAAVGITSIGILNGIIGEAVLAGRWRAGCRRWGRRSRQANSPPRRWW